MALPDLRRDIGPRHSRKQEMEHEPGSENPGEPANWPGGSVGGPLMLFIDIIIGAFVVIWIISVWGD